jgi:hypothetical protein
VIAGLTSPMLLASGVFVLLAGTAEAVSTNRTIDDE